MAKQAAATTTTPTTPATPAAPAPAPLLALDAPRTIRISINGTPVDFTVARIPDAGWRKCLEAIITRVEQVMLYPNGPDQPGEAQRTRIVDEESAIIGLFQYVLQVKGYAGTTGLGDQAIKDRVPMRHRLAVCQVLRAVGASTPTEAALSELAEVELNCPWTAAADGTMQEFSGLIHRFRQPTLAQYKRWRAGTGRVATTGDASNGVTTYPSRLAVALGLYDEMIAEVEGYSVAGKPVTDIATITANMDGMHKARAVAELFDRSDEDLSIGGPVAAAPATGTAPAEAEDADGAATSA